MKKILFFILFGYSLFISAQQPDALHIDPSGKIGIGTNAPQKTMHINGELQVDSSLTVLGNFLMRGETTSPTFAIDADRMSGGRFLVDRIGNITMGATGGKVSIRKDAMISGLLEANNVEVKNNFSSIGGFIVGDDTKTNATAMNLKHKDHEWVIWTSTNPSGIQGLTPRAFEIWDYPGNNPRLIIQPTSESNNAVVIDGANNLWVKGSINGLQWNYAYKPPKVYLANVFEKDYELMPLEDLAKHIEKNKQLPGISLKSLSVEQDISLDQLQLESLNKIKELTRYLLEMNETFIKENEALKKRIELLEAKIK